VFLGFGAALAGAGATAAAGLDLLAQAPVPQSAGAGTEADLVVINARVFTVDQAMPRAEAFAVKDGRFLAVGSTSDIRNLASTRTRVIDAAGQTVTP